MDHCFALLDVLFEHVQSVATERFEVLLDLDLDVRARQRAAQSVAMLAELAGDAG